MLKDVHNPSSPPAIPLSYQGEGEEKKRGAKPLLNSPFIIKALPDFQVVYHFELKLRKDAILLGTRNYKL